MQKKTEPSQILFAALALQRSQLILHPYPSLLIPSFLQYQHLQAEGSRPRVSTRDTVSHGFSLPTLLISSEAVSFIKGTSLSACLSREPSEWEFLAKSVHWQVWTDGCLDETATFVSGLTHMLKWPKMRKSGEGGRE